MKIDFREIQVKDIEGNNSTVDIAKMLGNTIYQKTADLGELELAQQIYKNGEVELLPEQSVRIKEYVKSNFVADELLDLRLLILGALGGIEAIRLSVTFLAYRKTNARKEKATADSMELQNLLSIIENLNKQIERYDERLKQRDEKVDTIYREWRTAQAEAHNWMRKYYELELALKDAEHNRCDRPDSECSRRTPPRRPITINNQNKEESNE